MSIVSLTPSKFFCPSLTKILDETLDSLYNLVTYRERFTPCTLRIYKDCIISQTTCLVYKSHNVEARYSHIHSIILLSMWQAHAKENTAMDLDASKINILLCLKKVETTPNKHH